MLWRQGDVLMASVEAIPDAAKPKDDGVLAEGEITGHTHRIAVPESAELWEVDGVLYMKVVAPTARIIHEEHHPIELPEGIYRVWRQREYTPRGSRHIYD
jgi:hypothetical protein